MFKENELRTKLHKIYLPGLIGVCLDWYYNPALESRVERAITLLNWIKKNMTTLRSVKQLSALRTAAWWIRDICWSEMLTTPSPTSSTTSETLFPEES